MADEITVIVEGATSARGNVTGRNYQIRAEKRREITAPEGEFATFPANRITRKGDAFESGSTGENTGRSYVANGSWKTFYEDGEEIDRVQCSKEEAKAWVEGETSLSDIQD